MRVMIVTNKCGATGAQPLRGAASGLHRKQLTMNATTRMMLARGLAWTASFCDSYSAVTGAMLQCL
jgi:hypothetical protein